MLLPFRQTLNMRDAHAHAAQIAVTVRLPVTLMMMASMLRPR
ncbi:hypothetical protein HMPREF3196_02225 [Bifidobacterium bifidum]|uniref:Uncharacterized protein n=1 Tax=Bifidobacterium bifidum TaxID=1681 RepID=A0A133KJB7_BIFBI|nr:hypothetical protein HMPREF3196_02225 [Bifidobacterium bifidum]